MDQAAIDDLKQFMATLLTQQTTALREDVEQGFAEARKDMEQGFAEVKQEIQRLDHKIDDLSESVAEALDKSNVSTDQQLKDHERRITRLEHKTA